MAIAALAATALSFNFLTFSAGLTKWAALAFLVGIFLLGRVKGPLLPPGFLGKWLAGYLLVFLLASAFALNPIQAFFGAYNFHTGALTLFLLCVVSGWAASSAPQRLLRWWAGLAAAISLYGALQYVGWDPFGGWAKAPPGRCSSTMGNPVHLGAFLAMALPVSLTWVIGGWGCLFLILFALLATFSRGAWLAALAGVMTWLLYLPRFTPLRRAQKIYNSIIIWRGREIQGVLLRAGLLALMAAAGVWGISRIYSKRYPTLSGRLSAALRWEDSAWRERLHFWKAAAAGFSARPVLGAGPDNFDLAWFRHKSPDFARIIDGGIPTKVHSEPLAALAETGVLGFIFWAGLWVWAFRRAWSRRKEGDSVAAPIAGGLAAFLVAGLFSFPDIAGLTAAFLFLGMLSSAPLATAEARAGSGASVLGVGEPWGWGKVVRIGARMGIGFILLLLAVRGLYSDARILFGVNAEIAGKPSAIEHYRRAASLWQPWPVYLRQYADSRRLEAHRREADRRQIDSRLQGIQEGRTKGREERKKLEDSLKEAVRERDAALNEARAAMEKATRLAPRNPYNWLVRGSLETDAGDWEKAMEYFDRAVELDPANPYLYNARGALKAGLAAFADAEKDFRKALEIDPEFESARENLQQMKAAVRGEDFGGE